MSEEVKNNFRKALIVDDSAADRVLYRRYLNQDQDYLYQFKEAVEGETGIEFFGDYQPDFILLDYKLPDMDGLEFLAALKDSAGKLPCPVILLTGQGDETIATACLKAGAQDYQVKGKLTADTLCRSVHYSLETYEIQCKLEEQHLLNVAILESITDAFFALDRELHFTYINRQAEKLFGKNREELLGTVIELTSLKLTDILGTGKLRQILDEGKVHQEEIHSTALDVWFELRTIPTKEGLSVFFQDITGRKREEEQRQGWNEELEKRVVERTVELTAEVEERKRLEEALKRSQGLYQALVRNLPECMILLFDHEMHFLLAEGPLLAQHELSPDEMIGKTTAEFFSPEMREWLEPNYEATLAGIERSSHYKHNNRFYITYTIPIRDRQDKILMGMVLVNDITLRKQAEEALRQSREMYRLLARNLPDSSVLIFDRDLRFLIAEGGLLEKSGFTREMLEGKTLQEVLRPEDAARLLPYYQAALAGIENNFEDYYDDQVYMVRAVPILDEQRRIVAGMIFSENITALKQAQQILAEEKEQLSVTLRSIGDGVITTDLSGKVLVLNRVAEELTGWVQNEAIGLPITDILKLVDQATRQNQVNPVEDVIKSGQIVLLRNNIMLVARDGTERLISDSCAAILDQQSKIIGVVLVFRDITEQKWVEEELQKTSRLEALGVLAGGIAHDFNNLLSGILGFLDLIDLNLNNEKAVEAAQIIYFIGEARKATIRAKDLTFQLLTFARGGNPIRKLASLNQIIQESTNFALHGRNVEVVFNLPEQLWTVEVDNGQLGQVIQNLVINAAQAMPEGGRLTFSGENLSLGKETLTQLAPGKYVRVSLQDTGLGIALENLVKIFDPYYTTKTGGSGLGLAVCYSIIKKHEGYITVESELGKGTTFHVYLPVSGNLEEIEKPPVLPRRVLYSQDNKYRVLVMDDEPSLRDVLKRTLNRLGSEVEVAKNGGEAIKLYEAALKTGQPFDIVFLDLTVPGGMGGKQTVVYLRELDPQVKAVVCSGYSSDPIMSNYQEYGFWDVLTKPFQIEELVKVLKRVSQE